MFLQESFKLRVLFIMHLPPPVHGAAMAGNYIKTSRLINDEFKTIYINLATNKKLSESGKGSIKKLLTFFSLVKNVVATLRKSKFDICHVSLTASGLGFYKDLIIVSILKIFGNKIVYHFHNKGVKEASNNWINRLLYRFVFRNTKSILLSLQLYPDIEMYVKSSDVFYCPYGIPPVSSHLNVKEYSSENLKKCKFLYLSNMMIEKGVYVLLDAVKELKNRQLFFECHYVGAWSDVTEEAFKKKVYENGLKELVFAHGPKYGSEKEFFFNEADIFLFPTFYHYETFGIVNLEAMQYSLPIVSTPEGGIPDVVVDGETGFLVPQNNSKELADKLELLIKQPELRLKMGIAGKERFENLFTLNKFERRLIEIIKEAAD